MALPFDFKNNIKNNIERTCGTIKRNSLEGFKREVEAMKLNDLDIDETFKWYVGVFGKDIMAFGNMPMGKRCLISDIYDFTDRIECKTLRIFLQFIERIAEYYVWHKDDEYVDEERTEIRLARAIVNETGFSEEDLDNALWEFGLI